MKSRVWSVGFAPHGYAMILLALLVPAIGCTSSRTLGPGNEADALLTGRRLTISTADGPIRVFWAGSDRDSVWVCSSTRNCSAPSTIATRDIETVAWVTRGKTARRGAMLGLLPAGLTSWLSGPGLRAEGAVAGGILFVVPGALAGALIGERHSATLVDDR